VSDPELLVHAAIRDGIPTVSVSSEFPIDVATKMPLVIAYRIGGGVDRTGLADRPLIGVQVLAQTRAEASGVAYQVRDALMSAWRLSKVFSGHGSIAFLTEVTGPIEIPDEDKVPNGAHRYASTYRVTTRP